MTRIEILLFLINRLRKLWDKHCAEWMRLHGATLISSLAFTVAIGAAIVAVWPNTWQGEGEVPPRIVASKDLVNRPDWLRKPKPDELQRYFPDRAYESGISGFAVISCISYPDNRVRNCKVDAHGPTGYGFDEAAISIARIMRFRPGRDAKGDVHATVRVPLHFVHPDNFQLLNDEAVLPPPKRIWDRAPSFEDLEAAFPSQNRSSDYVVRLECKIELNWTLSNCGVVKGFAPDPRAERAALSLTPRFRLFAEPWKWAVLTPNRIKFSIWFQHPSVFEGAAYKSYLASVMKDPERSPELAALSEQLYVDKVIAVNCIVNASGQAANCHSAEPGNVGSSATELMIRAAEGGQFDLWSRYGTPVNGGIVSLRYDLKTGQGPVWSF